MDAVGGAEQYKRKLERLSVWVRDQAAKDAVLVRLSKLSCPPPIGNRPGEPCGCADCHHRPLVRVAAWETRAGRILSAEGCNRGEAAARAHLVCLQVSPLLAGSATHVCIVHRCTAGWIGHRCTQREQVPARESKLLLN